MSLKIGNIELKSRVILAPMAGITTFSYRKFMASFGVGATYTEMISDCGLIYDNKRTKQMIESDGKDRPLGIQLFGGSKETLLKGAKIIEELGVDYDFLDLNFACPVPKVTKNNGGSSWLQNTEELYETTKAIVEQSSKPVTAKIRLGYNTVNVIENCKALEKAGVAFIAIHARTRKELYAGKPHFEELATLKDEIKIPFGVSGNIFSVGEALEALRTTRANAILVARGGEGNPELITNINHALNNEPYDETQSFQRQKGYLFTFAKMLIEEKGEQRAISMLKGIAPKFFNYDFPFVKELRKNLSSQIDSYDKIVKIVDEYEKKYVLSDK